MRLSGLSLFAVVSLAAHLSLAAAFLSPLNEVVDEKGTGAAALEIGGLFETVSVQAVKAQPVLSSAQPHEVIEPVTPVSAIETKEFVATVASELSTSDLEEPDYLKPVVVATAVVKVVQPTSPKRVVSKAKKKAETKRKRLKKAVKRKKVRKQTKKLATKRAKARAVQVGSKASRKGSATARKDGRKGAKGGNGGKRAKAHGRSAISSYKGKVLSRINRKKRTTTGKAKSKVVVRFVIQASGAVSGIQILRSSGNPRVDREAKSIIRRANPFPSLIRATGRSRMVLQVPMRLGS